MTNHSKRNSLLTSSQRRRRSYSVKYVHSYQPRSQGLSLHAPQSGGGERPCERGCTVLCAAHMIHVIFYWLKILCDMFHPIRANFFQPLRSKTKLIVTWVTRVFPRLVPVVCRAPVAPFSRAWHRLHVFPRWSPAARISAPGCMFLVRIQIGSSRLVFAFVVKI